MPSVTRKTIIQYSVVGVAALAILSGAALWWHDKQSLESTDNAFVQADTVQVSPQISGYIAEVLVRDNQPVEAGQVLAKIDPAPFKAKLDQAIANANALKAAIRAVDDNARLEQAVIAQRVASMASAKASAHLAQADLERYGALAAQGWVSPQKIQSQKALAEQADAGVNQAAAAVEAQRRTAQSLGSARSQSLAQAAGADAIVRQARIDLDRTIIRAPASGVVGARAVRLGQLVQPGSALMAIVPLERTFVVANFKETQVARLRIGQVVTIRADAFGGQPIKGRLESFAPATGAEFALIPVENAVGNFTKIAQRVPVRIAVDPGAKNAGLRPGLSVEVKVDVRDQSGLSFASSSLAGPRVAGSSPDH